MLLITIIYIVVSLVLATDALMREENPYRAMCRMAAILFVPVVGILLYLLDGRRSSTRYRMPAHGRRHDLSQFVRNACGEPVTAHNSVVPLHDAGATYAAIICALQRARSTILLEYYIFADDRLGRVLCDILERKARAGVSVCVIYDAIGSWGLKRRTISRLRCAGVDVRPFKPLRFPWIRGGVARRNHRKIAIIDSQVAFTGGINIAKRYIDGDSLGRWRDEHLRIEGDAVERLRQLFIRDWSACGGDTEWLQARCGGHRITDCSPMQIVWNDDAEARQSIQDLFTAAIAEAEESIKISTPYFIPPQGVFDSLRIAAARGVRVEVMTPERGDSRLTTMVTESYLRRIEECGAEVYRYDNGFLHSKMLVIDDKVASVGTANFDYRSLCENLEVMCLSYDPRIIAHLCEQFEQDKSECISRSNGSQDAGRASATAPLLESLARLLSPLL